MGEDSSTDAFNGPNHLLYTGNLIRLPRTMNVKISIDQLNCSERVEEILKRPRSDKHLLRPTVNMKVM